MDDGIEMENQDVRGERRGRVDVLAWLSRATLDVIGLAGTFPPDLRAPHPTNLLSLTNRFRIHIQCAPPSGPGHQ